MAVEHDPPAAYDDISTRTIALVGGVGAVLVFVSIIAVQVIYFRYNDVEYEQKVLDVPTARIDEILAAQRQRISQAGPGADPEKGEKSVPIRTAMAEVVAEYRQRQSQESPPEAGAPAEGQDPAEADPAGAASEPPAAE